MSKTAQHAQPLEIVKNLFKKRYPKCRIEYASDGSFAQVYSPIGDETMHIDVFIHHTTSGNTSAYRYKSGMEIPSDEKIHYWISIQDKNHQTLYHKVTCCLESLRLLINNWLTPSAFLEKRLRVTPPDTATCKTPATIHGHLKEEVDTSLLENLDAPLLDTETALQQLKIDIAAIDLQKVLQHWPRDSRGRITLRTTVILNAYDPATRKRQPVLCLTSASKQQAEPELQLKLSMEFLYNHRYQWKDTRWLWTQKTAEKKATVDIQHARKYLSSGCIEDACDLFNIKLDESVRRLAAGLPITRFEQPSCEWQKMLIAALCQLAPWKLQEGLARIQTYLTAANKKPPKPGSWERKLFWFPHQQQSAKQGLGIRFNREGAAELFIICTASNEYFPEPDWFDYPANT